MPRPSARRPTSYPARPASESTQRGRRSHGSRRAIGSIFTLSALLNSCGPTAPTHSHDSDQREPAEAELGPDGDTEVIVELSSPLAEVAPNAFGMHSSVYDNALHDPAVPGLLRDAGITLLRYPGGGYSDNYHWSTHEMTPWFGDASLNGYLADDSDFGAFVALLESFEGSAMLTVNYGSNLQSNGPGEPKEAAAWVAYANGHPEDAAVIGVDGAGNDWATVGYWAELRASEELPVDDGKNFLRIAHPEPLGVRYWEVGNEVFGNGYHDGGHGFEQDLHVPYDGTERRGHPLLSGSTYGAGVARFVREMKAVDPNIRVGAVLNTPPADYAWGPSWNSDVLAQAGRDIDFGIVHWYPRTDSRGILQVSRRTIPIMLEELRNSIDQHAGENTPNVELAVTELGPQYPELADTTQNESEQDARGLAMGIFAADCYVSFLKGGVFNVDWLELHNGSFLSERTQAPGPAYHGIRAAHLLARPGDTLVTTTVQHPASIVAHGARGANGSASVLLINTSLSITAKVRVQFDGGAPLGATATRYDYTGSPAVPRGTLLGPTSLDATENVLEVELPAFSMSVLRLAPLEETSQ